MILSRKKQRNDEKIDEFLLNPGIDKNRRKIEATSTAHADFKNSKKAGNFTVVSYNQQRGLPTVFQ